jgi:hypothetical protein
MWLFRDTPPLVIAAVLSKLMIGAVVLAFIFLACAWPAFLFFNGFGWSP